MAKLIKTAAARGLAALPSGHASRVTLQVLAAVVGLLGLAARGEVPDEFISHVQSDGTQYFDTGVIGKSYTKTEIDFTAEVWPTHGTCIFGSKGTKTKIIASTATIRRAAEQCSSLYDQNHYYRKK